MSKCSVELGSPGRQERAHLKALWAWLRGGIKGKSPQRAELACWPTWGFQWLLGDLGTYDSLSFHPGALPGSSAFPYTTQTCPTWAVVPARSCSGGPGVCPSSDTSSPPWRTTLHVNSSAQACCGIGVWGQSQGHLSALIPKGAAPSSVLPQLSCVGSPCTSVFSCSVWAELPDPLTGRARGAASLCTIQIWLLRAAIHGAHFSSPKTLKLEVDSKMFFSPLLFIPLREMIAKIPKLQCWQLSKTQVNAAK